MKFRWEHALAAFFGMFVLVVVGLVVMTLGDRNDLVQEHYYDAEIQYQRQIDRVARTLADSAEARIDSTSDGVRLAFPRRFRSDEVTGTVQLYRPDDKRRDLLFPLGLDSANAQVIPSALLAAGRWKVKVDWTARGTSYYAERTFMMP